MAVPLTRQEQTGRTLLRHIALKLHRAAADLAHKCALLFFLRLPGAALRPRCGHVDGEQQLIRTFKPNDLFRRGVIKVSELQVI